MTIKVLTIKQPHAGLIAAGIKTIENRTWSTKYQGILAIHASAAPDKEGFAEMRALCKKLGLTFPEALCSINGAILATVEFNHLCWIAEDGEPTTDHPSLSLSAISPWWYQDCIGWVMENPHPLKVPVPIKGKLGLWNLPPELERAILAERAGL